MGKDLCVIAQEKSDSNIKLLEEAKKKFDSVFFVPLDSIAVGLTDKFSITYRTTDLLRFPAVFARIPSEFSSFGYQLLSLFPQNTFMPIRPLSFLLTEERFFLLTVLRKRGIETLNVRLARSKKAADRVIEETPFPFIIRIPDKKTGVIVNSKLEAKSIVDALSSLDQAILFEQIIEEVVSLFVAGSDVITAVRKKSKEKDIVFSQGEYKSVKISLELEHLALEAVKTIDAQVARVDIAPGKEPCVVNVNLNPQLIVPSQVTGVNIPEKIIESISDSFDIHLKRPLLVKFFEDARSVVRDIMKTRQFL